MTTFQAPRSVLLVGAAGAGLRAAGEFLRDAGTRVFAEDADREEVARWAVGVGATVIEALPRVDLVIHTAAVSPKHPSVAAARRTGADVRSYPQWLGELTRRLPVVAVAGTHGKTTTAALLQTALGDASFLIGGACRRTGRSGGYTPGTPVVVEACEYRRHFLGLSPAAACVLPCEWDHPDCFKGEADVRAAFDAFVRRVEGPVLDLRETPPTPLGAEVPNLGRHLLGNAEAAVEAAVLLGVDRGEAVRRLADFGGLSRRYETLPDGPCLWIDDYAHHPTAVTLTLRQARAEAAGRPLIAVFEPHQASRLRAFGEGFAEALSLADEAWVLPVHAAREAAAGADVVAAFCRSAGPGVRPAADLDQLARLLETRRKAPCVIAVLGAGRIGRFLDERFPHLRGRTRPVRGDRAGGRGPRALHVAEGRRPGAVRRGAPQ